MESRHNHLFYFHMFVAAGSNGKILVVVESSTMVVKRTFNTLGEHTLTEIPYAVVSGNGESLVIKESPTSFSLWHLVSGNRLRHFSTDDLLIGELGPMALTKNAKLLATAHRPLHTGLSSIVVVWDLADGKIIHKLVDHNSLPLKLAFSPNDSSLICSDNRGECTEFYLKGKPLMTRMHNTHVNHPSEMVTAEWGPNSDYYVCGHLDGSVISVQSNTSKYDEPVGRNCSHFIHSANGDSVRDLDLKKDGARVAVVGGRLLHKPYYHTERTIGFVAMYETMTGKLCWKNWVDGYDGIIFSVSLSPDDSVVVSGGEDGFCRLWESVSGGFITKIGLYCPVIYVSFCVDIEEQQRRRIAVGMGGHERLGTASILSEVPADVINKIMRLV